MTESFRDEQGKFSKKGDEIRNVYSVRMTDKAWLELGYKAQRLGITRHDLLEQFALLAIMEPEVELEHDDPLFISLMQIIDVLQDALKLPGNQGNKIKTKIQEAERLLLIATHDMI